MHLQPPHGGAINCTNTPIAMYSPPVRTECEKNLPRDDVGAIAPKSPRGGLYRGTSLIRKRPTPEDNHRTLGIGLR